MKSKWALSVIVGLVAVAAYAANVLATPGTGFTAAQQWKGAFGALDVHMNAMPRYQVKLGTKGVSDIYVTRNEVVAGGQSGWHTHPGPSFIIVTQGSVTVYDGDDPTCTPHVYTAGTANNAFVDSGGGHVHLIRNETGSVATTIAVQLIPAGARRRQDSPDPGNCSF